MDFDNCQLGMLLNDSRTTFFAENFEESNHFCC
jgi:hypothetical protein